jgi:hypothetical protein
MTGVVPPEDAKRRLDEMVRRTESVRALDDALTVDAAPRLPTPGSRLPDRTLRRVPIDEVEGHSPH